MSTLDVLCINCESLVKFDSVDQHSKVCLTQSETSRKLDFSDLMLQIDHQLKIIQLSLRTSIFFSSEPVNSILYHKIILILTEILKIQESSIKSINYCKTIKTKLNSLKIPFDNVQLFLHHEKTLQLLKNKISCLKEKQKLSENEKTFESFFQTTKENLKNLADQSDYLKCPKSRDTGLSAASSYIIEENNNLFAGFSYIEDYVLEKLSESHEKKLFYSNCLHLLQKENLCTTPKVLKVLKLYRKSNPCKLQSKTEKISFKNNSKTVKNG